MSAKRHAQSAKGCQVRARASKRPGVRLNAENAPVPLGALRFALCAGKLKPGPEPARTTHRRQSWITVT
jgi:hypothetical protein